MVNTIRGLFQYKRLPFGIRTAAAIFQKVIDQILRKFRFARAYIDDIIIYADTLEELSARSEQILGTLLSHGFKLNFEKCEFFEK